MYMYILDTTGDAPLGNCNDPSPWAYRGWTKSTGEGWVKAIYVKVRLGWFGADLFKL